MKTPWWFLHKTLLAFLLLPVSWLYYLITRLVYICRKFNAYKSRRPIICIGNILAGGVGKTPIVREIATFLDAPIIMRGYKKTSKTGNVGDEATMMARDGLQVHVGNRKSNLILLNKQLSETGPIVMDDGFQNSGIKKDISILVFDDSIGYGNGFLLPAGPLREPKRAIKKANAVIVIKSNKPRKKFKIPYDVPTFYAETKTFSPYSENEKLFAFAGIGYPKKFFNALKNVVGKKAFPDHYQYTDKDLEQLIEKAKNKKAKLITTEKDWVRLPDWAKEEIKYAKLEMNIEKSFFQWLKENI